jgi:hypothetical protein
MNAIDRIGFHSDGYRDLPFAFGKVQPEQFCILLI